MENSPRIPVPAGEWAGRAMWVSCAVGTAEASGAMPWGKETLRLRGTPKG